MVLDAAPDRRIENVQVIDNNDTIVIEGESTYSDASGNTRSSYWCAILKIVDGLIISDHTYLDPLTYPGVEAVAAVYQTA